MPGRLTRRATGWLAAAVVLVAVAGWAIVRSNIGFPEPPPAKLAPRPPDSEPALLLPKKLGSLRFAVMGDVGRGDRAQYDTANEMARWHEKFEFEFVLMLGDNIYAAGTPEEYKARFERPYKELLDHHVTFQAAIGNHDPPDQPYYAPFNMHGNRYYSFSKEAGPPLAQTRVDFFALDTVKLDPAQMAWLTTALSTSQADWKVCFYHHPLYTSGRYRFTALQMRTKLEPIFVPYGVDVGFSGHEHFYERIVPQRGVQYFTSGGGGALRLGDIRPTALTAAGFDQDTHFMLVEIDGDHFYFQTISRTGQTVDHGDFKRVEHAAPPPLLHQ